MQLLVITSLDTFQLLNVSIDALNHKMPKDVIIVKRAASANRECRRPEILIQTVDKYAQMTFPIFSLSIKMD